MKNKSVDLELKNPNRKLWFFPMLFGLLGGFMGLFLRYVYTGELSGNFVLKNLLHSHSHVMLLGFIFNALVSIVWLHFTKRIAKKTYWLYVLLQFCVAILLIGFIIQGYAVYTIIFSTLHLWISYILLIRIWKQLQGEKSILFLVKTGILFHFIASIGPYALGPLKVLGFEHSPWYQQSIYFYLHFQYFGSFFLWMLAVLLKQIRIQLCKEQLYAILVSLVLLFSHSLDFSFDHWLINLTGAMGALLLFGLFFQLKIEVFRNTVGQKYRLFFCALMFILFLNIFGSVPFFSDLVVENRFLLIAWLHLLFLGVYLPFIWLESPRSISKYIWVNYIVFVVLTEIILVFPNELASVFSISSMMLLFISYFGVVLCISVVHLNFLIETVINELTTTR